MVTRADLLRWVQSASSSRRQLEEMALDMGLDENGTDAELKNRISDFLGQEPLSELVPNSWVPTGYISFSQTFAPAENRPIGGSNVNLNLNPNPWYRNPIFWLGTAVALLCFCCCCSWMSGLTAFFWPRNEIVLVSGASQRLAATQTAVTLISAPAPVVGSSGSSNTKVEVLPQADNNAPVAQATAVGSNDSYNIPPQPQVGHPSLYLETGVPCLDSKGCTAVDDHTKRWTLNVIEGTTAIVGGFAVDSVNNGVYKAVQGPAQLDTTVTDGFIAITQNAWANAEFCFRVGEAENYGWAKQHVSPINGWTCPAPALP